MAVSGIYSAFLKSSADRWSGDVELKPHQKRVHERLRRAPGVLVYHGLGSGKCVLGDTVIVTSAGVAPIFDLFPVSDFADEETLVPPSGLRVWSENGWRPVRALYRQKISEPVRRLRTVRGNEMACTQAHPLLVLRDGVPTWVPAGYVRAGDWVAFRGAWGDGAEALDPLLELLLWQITEGHERPDRATTWITQRDVGVLDRLLLLYRSRFSESGHVRRPRGGKAAYLDIASRDYQRYLAETYGHVWGRKSAEKRLPAAVFRLSFAGTVRAIAALFEAEGSVTPTTVEWVSASPVMAQQVQALLRRVGITAAIRRKMCCATNTAARTKRPYYRLTITGASRRRFGEIVPSIGKDWTYDGPEAVNPNHGIPWDWLHAKLGRFGLLGRVKGVGVPLNRGRSLSRPSAERLLGFLSAPSGTDTARGGTAATWKRRTNDALVEHAAELQVLGARLRALLDSDYRFEEIQTAGSEPFSGAVYDLEVDGDRYDEKQYTLASGWVAHNTMTSITAAADAGLDAEAVVPASLRTNYRKELDKVRPEGVRFDVKSYDQFTRDPNTRGRLLVLDEAQRLQDPESARAVAALRNSPRAAKRLALSATPIQNHPREIAPLMNVVAGDEVLPTGEAFDKKFLGQRKVPVGFLARLRGVEPGSEEYLRDRRGLAKAVSGMVDYHPSAVDDFPSVNYRDVDVQMDPRQKAVYDFVVAKQAPRSLRWKLERGLPPSKRESGNLNAFLSGARTVSNTPAPYQDRMTPEEGVRRSPKMQRVVADLAQGVAAHPRFKGLVYSNYLEGGVQPVSSMLRELKIPHHVFHGSLSDAERKRMVDDYNHDRVRALLISGAGAEGLDLKGTRMVQILEPHWNESRLKQVVGRAVRYRSHAHLPGDERSVEVRRYKSTLPRTWWDRLRGGKARGAADEYLYGLAGKKQKLIDQALGVLQEEGSKPV